MSEKRDNELKCRKCGVRMVFDSASGSHVAVAGAAYECSKGGYHELNKRPLYRDEALATRIKTKLALGYSQRAVAKIFNVSRYTVAAMVKEM